MNQMQKQERPMSVLRALLHFFGPGCIEDFIRGWNAVSAASEEKKIAQSTIRVNHAVKGDNGELFSRFHFRPEDSWDFPTDADGTDSYPDVEESSQAGGISTTDSDSEWVDCMTVAAQIPKAKGYPENQHDSKGIHDEDPVEVPHAGHIEMPPCSLANLEELWKISPEEQEESGAYYQFNTAQNASYSGHRRCIL